MDPPKLENVFQWRDPSNFAWGPWKFKWWGAPDPQQKMSTESPARLQGMKARAFVKFWWPWWGGWIDEIIAGVTSDVRELLTNPKDTNWFNVMAQSSQVNFFRFMRSHLSCNTLRPRQDGRYFADDVLKCIFLNENVWISLKIPLKFVRRGPINNIPALVQIMAWRRPGDKPLSEPMLVFVSTHICITQPQWVKTIIPVW